MCYRYESTPFCISLYNGLGYTVSINSSIPMANNGKDSLSLMQLSSLLDPPRWRSNRETWWLWWWREAALNVMKYSTLKGIHMISPHNPLAKTSQIAATVGPESTMSLCSWETERWKHPENSTSDLYSFPLISVWFLCKLLPGSAVTSDRSGERTAAL